MMSRWEIWDTGGPGTGVAHVWPTRSPFDKGHIWAAPTRFPGHACPSGLQIFGQIFFFFLPGASHAAGRRGPGSAWAPPRRGPCRKGCGWAMHGPRPCVAYPYPYFSSGHHCLLSIAERGFILCWLANNNNNKILLFHKTGYYFTHLWEKYCFV